MHLLFRHSWPSSVQGQQSDHDFTPSLRRAIVFVAEARDGPSSRAVGGRSSCALDRPSSCAGVSYAGVSY